MRCLLGYKVSQNQMKIPPAQETVRYIKRNKPSANEIAVVENPGLLVSATLNTQSIHQLTPLSSMPCLTNPKRKRNHKNQLTLNFFMLKWRRKGKNQRNQRKKKNWLIQNFFMHKWRRKAKNQRNQRKTIETFRCYSVQFLICSVHEYFQL